MILIQASLSAWQTERFAFANVNSIYCNKTLKKQMLSVNLSIVKSNNSHNTTQVLFDCFIRYHLKFTDLTFCPCPLSQQTFQTILFHEMRTQDFSHSPWKVLKQSNSSADLKMDLLCDKTIFIRAAIEYIL